MRNTNLSQGLQLRSIAVSVIISAKPGNVGYCDFNIPVLDGWIPWVMSIGQTESTDDRHCFLISCSMRNNTVGMVQAYNTWNVELTHTVMVNIYYSRAWRYF